MSEPLRLLFVCLGNICRSPAGENVMRHLVEQEGHGDRIAVDSAGTAGWHAGNPPDSRMIAAARARGIPMGGRARQVRASDFSEFDYIFAMDRSNAAELRELRGICPEPKARLMMFCELCEEHEEEEVPDPYYGGEEGFDQVLDLLDDGCRAFLRRWERGDLT